MLNKNVIIKGFTSGEFIVRKAIYEYVCKLHLYDDEKINKAFINFIENNYNEIDLKELEYSKLNKDIIESLIKIFVNEENKLIKENISYILVKHYNLIKDMTHYNFEKIIENEDNLLLYKKIKHFSKKDPTQLIQMYKNNIKEYYFSDNDTFVTATLRTAIGIALIQTKEGCETLTQYIKELIKSVDENLDNFNAKHMPYLLEILCIESNLSYYPLILDVYLYSMESIENVNDCNYYFSNICNDDFVNYYIDELKSFNKKDLEDYYYDIAEYLNSDLIDKFLLEELNRTKDNSIKEKIICILARKFNKNILPYALNFIRKGRFEYEETLKEAVAPLLILEKSNDEESKGIIQEVKNYYEFYEEEWEKIRSHMMSDLLSNMQNLLLKKKPHIKEYKKIRKLYNEVIKSMLNYLLQGKFKLKLEREIENIDLKEGGYINSKFDTRSDLGMQAMINVTCFKNSSNINCITEEFIKHNRYRTQEKIELLDSMLNSKAGLFEISRTDTEKGQVYLRNVLTNEEFCITDIGLSSNLHNDKMYFYTRIITYHGVSFGTGLNIAFDKNDEFICKWIKENLSDLDTKQEIVRFMEIYNEYESSENRINVRAREV